MSNYDPPQQPWGGPPQDPYGGAPQYPPPQQQGGYPPSTSAFPPGGGGFPPPTSGAGGYPPPSSGAGGFPPPGGGYPPAGGGYPPPADPYGGGGFQDPYAQPQPDYGQQGGFGQQGGYGGYQPPAPARGGGSTKIVLIIAGIVLLALCGGGIFTAYKLTSDSDDGDTTANPTATSTAGASGGASSTGRPTSTPTGTRTATPTSGSGGSNPDTFVKGDCFVNEGTESDPEVRKVPCTTANAYEVVVKIPFTTDEDRCDSVAGAGNWNASYVMDKQPGTTGDYVLCLKKR
jgi:hypothetical protein